MSRLRRVAYDPSDDSVKSGESDIQMLKQRMNYLEREVGMLSTADAPEPPDDAGTVNRDARWHCRKCGYLLGFYDLADDVLRTRYKEHIVYVRVGDGGFVQVVCRGCSQVNTQHYSPDTESAPEAG